MQTTTAASNGDDPADLRFVPSRAISKRKFSGSDPQPKVRPQPRNTRILAIRWPRVLEFLSKWLPTIRNYPRIPGIDRRKKRDPLEAR